MELRLSCINPSTYKGFKDSLKKCRTTRPNQEKTSRLIRAISRNMIKPKEWWGIPWSCTWEMTWKETPNRSRSTKLNIRKWGWGVSICLMVKCYTVAFPLQRQWRYYSLALSHQDDDDILINMAHEDHSQSSLWRSTLLKEFQWSISIKNKSMTKLQ